MGLIWDFKVVDCMFGSQEPGQDLLLFKNNPQMIFPLVEKNQNIYRD